MVRINRIYTRKGDDGSTGLVGGHRILKSALRVETYGDVDELNSWIGSIRTSYDQAGNQSLAELCAVLQNELFNVGALLASPAGSNHPSLAGVGNQQVEQIEREIDRAIEGLPELTSFVLPGGTQLNASLHIARTVCRRAERHAVALNLEEPLPENLLKYLNRLSDLLFALARKESFDSQTPEYLWKA